MAGNIFANAGLVAQGMDASRERALRLAEMERANRFNTEADPIRLEEARQRSRRAGLGLEEAGMSLDEIRRKRAEEATERAAVSGATDVGGAFDAAATARLRAGNLPGYTQATDARATAQRNALKEIANAATLGLPPEQARQRANQMGLKIDRLNWSVAPEDQPDTGIKKGETIILMQDGSNKIELPVTRLHDFLNPQKSEVHSAGQYGTIITTPGKAPTVLPGALVQDKFNVRDGIIWNERSGESREIGTGKDWELKTIPNGNMEVPVAFNTRTHEVNILGPGGVRTGLKGTVTFPPAGQVGNPIITLGDGRIMELKPATEATLGNSGWNIPFVGTVGATPGTPGAPARLEPIQPAEQPPRPDAKMGRDPDGKAQWYVPDPKSKSGWALLPTTGVAPTSAPTVQRAAPAASVAPPTIAPSSRSAQADVRNVDNATSELPPLLSETSVGVSTSDKLRAAHAAAVESSARSNAAAAAKAKAVVRALTPPNKNERLVAAIRDMFKNGYRKSDAPVIEEAIKTGLLTPAETAKARAMLAQLRVGFSRGGPVTRYQGYGLG